MENLPTILSILSLIGIIIAVYKSFTRPAEVLEKKQLSDAKEQAIVDERADKKAEVLERQVQWEKEANDKKFMEFSEKLKEAFLLAANHTNTVSNNVDKLDHKFDVLSAKVDAVNEKLVRIEAFNTGLGEYNKNLGVLTHLIEDRLPKK